MKKILMYLSAFLPMFFIMWFKEVATVLVKIHDGKSTWLDLINIYLIIEIAIIGVLIISFSNLMSNNKKLATKKSESLSR